MSRIEADAAGLSDAQRAEDARLDLVAAATRHERSNRPVYLVVVASALLAAGLVSLAWGVWERGAAAVELSRQRDAAGRLATAVGRLRELEAARARSGTVDADAPMPNILTQLQASASKAGIANIATLLPRTSKEAKVGAVQRVKFEFTNLREEKLDALLGWMRFATEDVPGLEVYSVTLKPEAATWSMSVTFTRWERTG